MGGRKWRQGKEEEGERERRMNKEEEAKEKGANARTYLLTASGAFKASPTRFASIARPVHASCTNYCSRAIQAPCILWPRWHYQPG